MIVSGALLLADAATTLLWQEPISAFLAHRSQDELARDLGALERAGPTALELQALRALPTDRARIAFLARRLKRDTQPGGAVGRIVINRIHASYVVVDGTETASLRKGPGVYPETPFPGAPGTTAIAGHRTTYGAPFRQVDRLRPDDRIELRMPYATFVYSVEQTRIVAPTALWVIKRRRYDRLVLSACHPLYSAAKRIVVFARLSSITPKGQALAGGGAA